MRRSVYLPLFLFALFCLGFAEVPKTEEFLNDGEHIRYVVKWVGIPAGEITMDCNKMEKDGKPAYRIYIEANSNHMTSLVYQVRDRIVSYIDADDFRSYSMEKMIHEGNRRKYEKIEFNYDENKLIQTHQNISAGEKKEVQEDELNETQIIDSVASIFYLRTLDYTSQESLRKESIRVFNEGKAYNLHFQYLGEKVLYTAHFGRRHVYHIKPTASLQGVFVSSGEMEMWLDKETGIPLRIKLSIPVGYGTIEIAECHHPKLQTLSYRERRRRGRSW